MRLESIKDSMMITNREDFFKCACSAPLPVYASAREEMSALTEENGKVEAEIDARVKSLYGL